MANGNDEEGGRPAQADERQATTFRQKVSTIASGLIVVWVGGVLLAGGGWGLVLIGIGIGLLCEQLARWHFAVPIDQFWLAGGAVSLLGGLLLVSGFDVAIGPIVLIVVGLAIVLSALSRGRSR